MREELGEEAENNREFQEARKKFDAEQLKAQKLEKKRNLFESGFFGVKGFFLGRLRLSYRLEE